MEAGKIHFSNRSNQTWTSNWICLWYFWLVFSSSFWNNHCQVVVLLYYLGMITWLPWNQEKNQIALEPQELRVGKGGWTNRNQLLLRGYLDLGQPSSTTGWDVLLNRVKNFSGCICLSFPLLYLEFVPHLTQNLQIYFPILTSTLYYIFKIFSS